MSISTCGLALLALLSCVAASRAQQPGGAPAAAGMAPEMVAPITAELVVADTEQFCPTTVRLRIDVPHERGEILTQEPFFRFERRTAGGEWECGHEAPRGTNDPQVSACLFFPGPGSGSSCGGPPTPRWRFRGGQSATFVEELSNWCVLGYSGTYRVRATWGIAGDVGRRNMISPEFQVRPAGADGEELRKAQAVRSELWTAYKQFMNGKLRIAVPSPYQLGEPSVQAGGFMAAVFDHPTAPWNTLRRAAVLPAAVRARLDAHALCLGHTLARTQQAAQRPQSMGRLIADCAVLGGTPGYVGAFARLQGLVFTRAHDAAAAFEAALVGARQDRDLLDVGLSFPDAMRLVGLLVEDMRPGSSSSLPGPQNDQVRRGPSGPTASQPHERK